MRLLAGAKEREKDKNILSDVSICNNLLGLFFLFERYLVCGLTK